MLYNNIRLLCCAEYNQATHDCQCSYRVTIKFLNYEGEIGYFDSVHEYSLKA